MKKVIATLLLLAAMSGCVHETPYGQCVGVFNEEDRSPKLVYRTSVLNVVLGAVFFQTIFAPLLAFGWDLYCPVGPKQ